MWDRSPRGGDEEEYIVKRFEHASCFSN
jgi:hypothetical protein